jgi:hypothetical protein
MSSLLGAWQLPKSKHGTRIIAVHQYSDSWGPFEVLAQDTSAGREVHQVNAGSQVLSSDRLHHTDSLIMDGNREPIRCQTCLHRMGCDPGHRADGISRDTTISGLLPLPSFVSGKQAMPTNVMPSSWTEFDSAELLHILFEHIGEPGQYDGIGIDSTGRRTVQRAGTAAREQRSQEPKRHDHRAKSNSPIPVLSVSARLTFLFFVLFFC